MDTTKEQPKVTAGSLKELLDKLAWQRDAEALYGAFIEALDSIPDMGIKTAVCVNTVRYITMQKATARAKDKENDDETASLFEEEAKRCADDIMKMPAEYREWLKKTSGDRREQKSKPTKPLIDLLVTILGGPPCECERCKSFRASVGEPDDADAERPTEPPPPPDPIN